MAELAGLPAVIDAEAREAPLPGAAPLRQPSLFAVPDLAPAGDHVGDEPAPGRRGRPPGSRNRRTQDLAAYIAGHVGHPVVRLARIAAMDPAQLAQALGCKQIEALDRIIVAAKAAAPFVAAQLPQEVKLSGQGALVFGLAPGGGMPSGDHLVVVDPLAALDAFLSGNIEQLQRVSDVVDEAGNAIEGNAEGESDDKSGA